jgi:DNA (cytosine-5)-methyltransferase 1
VAIYKREKLISRLNTIPVIDLFAGPGGLSEGFSSLEADDGHRRFDVRISIEKDPMAYQTLLLRALFRAFPKGQAPDCYYDYVQGSITRDELFKNPAVKDALALARSEARLAELGSTASSTTDGWIEKALQGVSDWALIGGPPCQAYSLAGRSRMKGVADFAEDKRHFLYKEYLRIIKKFRPAVFVMENVKGMLTSQHGGTLIFERIIADLRQPDDDLSYRIQSLVVEGEDLDPHDFVIQSEDYGIPQRRHRVILFGIRSDVAADAPALEKEPMRFKLKAAPAKVGVLTAITGLPRIRSRVSKQDDSPEKWLAVLKKAVGQLKLWRDPKRMNIELAMSAALKKAALLQSHGATFIEHNVDYGIKMPASLAEWYADAKLDGVLQHESRSHMASDLQRYLFASCYAALEKVSPRIYDFPPKLLPDHRNVGEANTPFLDRFRVQLGGQPSTTVVSHISKDGHYYIHPDASQCRSLTAREAARLQTFPDNYFFEGGRTQQFHQIGNAVPPLLARQIAEVVSDFLSAAKR